MMRKLIVPKTYHGKKLNTYLFDTFPGLSLNTFYKILRKKDIRINEKRIHQNVILSAGDTITLYISDTLLGLTTNEEKKKTSTVILYEDDFILLVNKPAGIEVTGSTSVTTYLQQEKHNNQIMPCHRLDRNTTGIVVFAKTSDSLEVLLRAFKDHQIEKYYLANVYGIPRIAKQTLTSYLFKDQKKSMVYIADRPQKGYVKIVTHYRILEKDLAKNTALLEVKLETGKTHQIRAHLAHIGHPIIGDGKYGNNQINRSFKAKSQQLCAYKIRFHFEQDCLLSYLDQKEFVIAKSF